MWQSSAGAGDRMRAAIAAAYLLFQAGAIVYARFVDARYFCWAPFDAQSEYRIEASVDGRPLAPGEIRRRYRRPALGVDNRSIRHVMDILEQVEQKQPPGERAEVTLRYRVNGGGEKEWRWPPR